MVMDVEHDKRVTVVSACYRLDGRRALPKTGRKGLYENVSRESKRHYMYLDGFFDNL